LHGIVGKDALGQATRWHASFFVKEAYTSGTHSALMLHHHNNPL
jgi:hypothetical protein